MFLVVHAPPGGRVHAPGMYGMTNPSPATDVQRAADAEMWEREYVATIQMLSDACEYEQVWLDHYLDPIDEDDYPT
jgi:hypothetical protein